MLWLRILVFIICMMVIAAATMKLIDTLMFRVIERPVCNYTVCCAQYYLMHHGRGHFEEQARMAVEKEVYIRIAIFMAVHVVLLLLVAFIVKSSWAFWIIPPWSIKAGLMLGIILSGVLTYLVANDKDSRAKVGRFVSIDDVEGKTILRFESTWGDDNANFKLEGKWRAEEFPPLGSKYVVLDYRNYLVWSSLELLDYE